jgi:glycine/D-amino acid oxidase-like deaminating enzyme
VARILIVGGGCRGRCLAAQLVQGGHALRVTTRSEDGRAAVEATGAECWIGTPDRLATLRGALDSVTVACWMLAGASGDREQVEALHASRLEYFISQAIDTTVRGLIYDAWPVAGADVSVESLSRGAQIVSSLAQLNAIPAVVLAGDARAAGESKDDGDAAWVVAAAAAIDSLLGVSAP